MSHIVVTPLPEMVRHTSSVAEFIRRFTVWDAVNTVITLGALTFAFYMFFRFSKYGKSGRDVSKETQDHDKESLAAHGVMPPAVPVDIPPAPIPAPTQIDLPGNKLPPVSRAGTGRAGRPTKKKGSIDLD